MKKLLIDVSVSLSCGIFSTFLALYVMACLDGAFNRTGVGQANLKLQLLIISVVGSSGIAFILLGRSKQENNDE